MIRIKVYEVPLSGNKLTGRFVTTQQRRRWFLLLSREKWKQKPADWKWLASTSKIIYVGKSSFVTYIPSQIKRTVTITQYRHSLLDEGDNLYTSIKPILDALKPFKVDRIGRKSIGLGLIYDDSKEWLKSSVTQIKIPRDQDQYTEIVIE